MARIHNAFQTRLSDLCRDIAKRHGLDAPAREALEKALQARISAYLTGEQPLTAEDAFLLVKKHFGDPAVIKGLLQDAHIREVRASLARRLCAAWIASVILGSTIGLAIMLAVLSGVLWVHAHEGSTLFGTYPLCIALTCIASVAVFWKIVRSWQRRMDAGEKPWFLRMSKTQLLGTAIGTTVLFKLIPAVTGALPMGFPASDRAPWFVTVSGWLIAAFVILTAGALSAHCLTWLWWCDRPPRQARTVATATVAWLLMGLLGSVIPNPQFVIGGTVPPGWPHSPFMLAQGKLWGTSLPWVLHWLPPDPTGFVVQLAVTFIGLLILGALARLAYEFVSRRDRDEEPLHLV